MHTIAFPDIPVPIQGLDEVVVPKMVRIRQTHFLLILLMKLVTTKLIFVRRILASTS